MAEIFLAGEQKGACPLSFSNSGGVIALCQGGPCGFWSMAADRCGIGAFVDLIYLRHEQETEEKKREGRIDGSST